MIKVFIGDRHCGATTKFISLIKEDLNKGLKVYFIGYRSFFDSISEDIEFKHNFIHVNLPIRLDGIDSSRSKIYVQDLLDTKVIGFVHLASHYNYELVCDKPPSRFLEESKKSVMDTYSQISKHLEFVNVIRQQKYEILKH